MARRNELKLSLQAVLEQRLKLSIAMPLEDEARINEDLRIDSIMLLQLLVFIEQDLRLSIPEEEVDAKAFATIGSLLDFLERLAPIEGTRAAEAVQDSVPPGIEVTGG